MGSLLNGGAHGEPKLRLVTPDEAPSDDRPDLQQASQQVEDLARHADLALESTHGITRELLAQDPALAERVGKVREKFEITLGKLDQLLPPDRKQRSLKPGEGDGPYRMIVHPEHQIQVAVDPVKVDPAKNAEILKMRLAELRDDLLPAFVNELSVRSLKIIGRLDAAIANVISEFNRSTADDSPLDFATHQNMLDIFQDEAILLLRHLVKRAASMPPEESGGLFRIADPQERWLQREVEAIVIRAEGYACALEGDEEDPQSPLFDFIADLAFLSHCYVNDAVYNAHLRTTTHPRFFPFWKSATYHSLPAFLYSHALKGVQQSEYMIDEFTSRNSDLIQRLEVSEPEFRALRFAPSNNDSFVGCNAYLRRHMVDKVPFLTTWLTEDGLWFEKRDALKKFFKVVPGEILIEDVNPDVFNKLFIHLQNPDVLAAMRERSLDEWRKAMDQIAREDL